MWHPGPEKRLTAHFKTYFWPPVETLLLTRLHINCPLCQVLSPIVNITEMMLCCPVFVSCYKSLPVESGRSTMRVWMEVSRGCVGRRGYWNSEDRPATRPKGENLNTWHSAVDLPSGNHSSTSQMLIILGWLWWSLRWWGLGNYTNVNAPKYSKEELVSIHVIIVVLGVTKKVIM